MGTASLETVGISPKVALPSAILAAAGVVAVALGIVLKEGTLAEIGAALLGASGITFGVGHQAKPGPVRTKRVR
jgi:hypothetical protein